MITKTLKEIRKEQILKAASKMFGRKGYWKTDMESIALLAKTGKGTIYRYFKNKEDLFLSLIDHALEELSERIDVGLSGIESVFERIKKAISTYLEFFEENFIYFNIINQENPMLKTKVAKKFWKKFFAKFDKIEENFKIGISTGLIKKFKSKDLIFLLIGMMHGEIQQWILDGRKYNLKDKGLIISEVFLKGVEKKNGK